MIRFISSNASRRKHWRFAGFQWFLSLLTSLPIAATAQVDGGNASPPQKSPPAMPALPVPKRPTRATPPGQGVNRPAPAGIPAIPFPGAPSAPGNPPGVTANPGPGDSTAAGSAISGSSTNVIRTSDEKISLNFVGMPMEQVLDEYSRLVNRTLLRANQGAGILPDKATITLKTKDSLTHEEAIQALEVVLGMNGVTIVPMGEKFAKVVTEAMASQSGGSVSTNDAAHIQDMGKFVTQIVQWKYATAQDINDVLKLFAKNPQSSIIAIPSTQTIILRDYAENVKRMLEMLERIDQPMLLEIKPEVIKIKYALASDIQQVIGSLGGSGGGNVSIGRSTAGGGLGSAGSRSALAGSSGTGNASGVQSGQTGAGGVTGGGGQRSAFQNNLQKLVQGAARGLGGSDFQILGQTKIIADERTNSLLVFANADDMKMIKSIIDKLDVVLAQVLIEAIIMEVSINDNRSVGISYLQHQQTKGNVSTIGALNNGNVGSANGLTSFANGGTTNALSGLTSGFSYLTSINRDLDIVMTAIQDDSRVNVLSRPRIQTSHAVPCSLFIGDTVPYITGSYYGGSYSGNSSQYTQKEIGIQLDVLPLINPDGLVVMDIRQNIEQLGTSVKIDGNDVPQTTKRNAEAKVAVRNRETIMLGGFIGATKSKSHSGVPVLMDIPVLGYLFRSNTDGNKKTELIVLIRPTVLPTPGDAAMFATEARDQMSGVKQAEISLREEERKRNEKIEAELSKEAASKARKAKANAKRSASNAGDTVESVQHWDDGSSNAAQSAISKQESGKDVPRWDDRSSNPAPAPAHEKPADTNSQ